MFIDGSGKSLNEIVNALIKKVYDICNLKLIDINYFIIQGVHVVVAAGGSNTDARSQTPAGMEGV